MLRSDIYQVNLAKRRDDWIRTIRGHWFQHRTGRMKSYGEQRCDFWYTSTFIPIKIFLAVAGSNLRHETMHRQMENENQWWLPGDV